MNPSRTLSWARWTPGLLMVLGLASALVLQHALGWLPCPLCILQRISAIGLAISLFTWAALPKQTARRIAMGVSVVLVLGAFSSGAAHLWVLAHPQTGSCGPGVQRFVGQLVEYIPGSAWMLEGAGSCDSAEYAILGLPLPLVSMALHGAALVLALAIANKLRR